MNPHEVALTGFFESDKDCAMVRDAALRGAFRSLVAFLCGMVRVRARPDCHQRCHQNHLSVPTSPTDLRSFSFTAQRLTVWRQKVVLWIVFEAGNFSIVSPKLVVETLLRVNFQGMKLMVHLTDI